MRDFNRDRRSSGRPDRGRDFKRRDFDDKPRIMHKTICSNCGKECEVPFKPNGSKPVFCRDCFQNNRSSDSRRSNFEDRSPSQTNGKPVAEPQYREQFESLNAKLDKILNLLTPKETVKEALVVKPTPVVEVPEVVKVKTKTSKLSKTKSSSAGKRVSKKSPRGKTTDQEG
jgi:CxxC-x17-CxxC domain-containing protein